MSSRVDELRKDANQMRSLYHNYKNMNPRNELDEARMIVAKNKWDEIKEELKKESYKGKVVIFLKDHPEMAHMFTEK